MNAREAIDAALSAIDKASSELEVQRKALRAALAQLGPEDVNPASGTAPPVSQPTGTISDGPSPKGGITPDKLPSFFTMVRPLWGRMTDTQVEGVKALLSAGAGVLPLSWMAYVLATAFHETGKAMVPNTENLNYSTEALMAKFSRERINEASAKAFGRRPGQSADQEAIGNIIYGGRWGAEHLGNTQIGDGYKFRGRAYPHITGRRNYQKADDALGLGGSLMANPDRALELPIAAALTVRGMVEGWFTGKSLRDYIPAKASRNHYTNARRVINGTDCDDTIAGYAVTFDEGLRLAGWT